MADLEFKSLWLHDCPKNYTEIFSYNGRKFRLHIEHSNGDPLGFNSNCALYVMVPDGTFKSVIDNRDAGIKYSNACYNNKLDEVRLINDGIVKSFKEFVAKVYG